MSAKAYRLKPWTEVVRPHEDILEGRLEMSTYAADLGAVDRDDPNTPRVYRDAGEFFRTTYFTRNLRQLLGDILRVLAGGPGDRVIQLRTPFGGGKTHALLALYHLLKSRNKIDASTLSGLPDPGPGRVAVLSGLDLDPVTPRVVDGLKIQTIWGELAFRLGGQAAYEKVRAHDERGASPAGDVLRPLLETGPLLILLDEVLVYVQRAGGRKGDDPLRRQVMIFLQALTEVVRGLPNAAMVYSLQASIHEAAGDEALLQDLDHLVTRIDAKREPVSDEEVMRVVQRRLFPTFGDDEKALEVGREVAREYALAFGRLRETYAETAAERRAVGQEAERFEKRVLDSYPFHPDLLDLMYHRWGSLPSYQRTRGALQFLARVTHALWNQVRAPQPLIGPGDVAFEDEHVRGAFFSQVGERERYSAVLAADITGDGARAREVDRRIASDVSALEQLRAGTRCATAIMLYSFGARQGEDRGVLESDLVQSLVAPDLDRNVITTALHDLREELLYLHYTGRRYRFEPKANLNLLISEESKKWGSDEVLQRIRDEVAELLKETRDRAVLWPPDSGAIPDGDPVFRVVYLGEDFTDMEESDLAKNVEQLVEEKAPGRREFQNSLAFAVPGKLALDRARTAARLWLAIDSLLGEVKKKRLKIEKEQVDELGERYRTVAADLTGAVDRLYEQVLVPVPDREGAKPLKLELIDLRAQISAGRSIHGRILDALRKHVFDSVTSARLVTLTKLGEEREYVACDDVVQWFFKFFDFPKITNEHAIRVAISSGTKDMFGYVSAARLEDGSVVPSRPELVRFGTTTPSDEIDLGPGSFILSPTLARELRGEVDRETTAVIPSLVETEEEVEEEKPVGGPTRYWLRAEASAAQLFRIFPALQNLADKAEQFTAKIEVEAKSTDAFDRNWLRNAVEEHFEEAGIEPDTSLG
jgi:predicted AAA+ superfamily ATPase